MLQVFEVSYVALTLHPPVPLLPDVVPVFSFLLDLEPLVAEVPVVVFPEDPVDSAPQSCSTKVYCPANG